MHIRNIGIIGTGGVGGYFGGKMAHYLLNQQNGKNNVAVYFIARGQHLEQIQANGLVLDSESDGKLLCKPTLATDDFSELPELDLVLLCIKSYDLEEVSKKIRQKLSQDSIILPLLNGVDIVERINEVIPDVLILPACVYVGTHIEKPGYIRQKGGTCKITFSVNPHKPDNTNTREVVTALVKILDQAHILYDNPPNAYPDIWKKFMFICAYGLVTSAYNKTLGEILDSQIFSEEVRAVMNEVKLLADKSGILLPDNIIEDSFKKGAQFPYETKTSFQRDYENPLKKDERDIFAGSMIKLGKKWGIAVPVSEKLSDLINRKKSAIV